MVTNKINNCECIKNSRHSIENSFNTANDC